MPEPNVTQAVTWLNTAFGDGTHFFETETAWLELNPATGLLHYVGLTQATRLPPRLQAVLQTARGILDPGFHRFHLQDGRVLLTLCVGQTHNLLTDLCMQADAVVRPPDTGDWTRWTWKLLAKQCRRGATLQLSGLSQTSETDPLQEAGFVASSDGSQNWIFEPHWKLTRSQGPQSIRTLAGEPRCAVIGAGLAGASAAYALASRGWHVTVLDQHGQPASGSSGLPAGLAVPHVSRDDNPRSRLTRTGISLLQQHARRLLVKDVDWSPGGVLELAPGSGQWHPEACWVRPARLVAAWLNHPRIRFLGSHAVHSVESESQQWILRDAHGSLLAVVPHVVFANAMAIQKLQISMATDRNCFAGLRAIRGVMSTGEWPCPPANGRQTPAFPVNGDGSFLPCIPGPRGMQWHCGATFEPNGDMTGEVARGHRANEVRLEKLLPDVAKTLKPQWNSPHLQAWSGERCTTHDRLPLVGALPNIESNPTPGLWCSIGMGARGLSLAALCAELLAADMLGEPRPIEARLHQSLRPDRLGQARPF